MPKILDTHIHLWPSTSVSPTNHGWMTPGHFLSARHGISDYLAVTRSSTPTDVQPAGFIYVETDRYLPSPKPDVVAGDDEDAKVEKLKAWAKEPLEELRFLRRIVEGRPSDGDGFESADSAKVVGAVVWAPFHLSHDLFRLYLRIAEETSGPRLWDKVVGFRYLLQAIKDETELRSLVESESWLQNLLSLRDGRGGKGWTFDVGVDTHSGDIWQLEVATDMVDRLRGLEEKDGKGNVTLVLNHLCKPDLSHSPSQSWPSFQTWSSLLTRLAAHPAIYMKFSGAFNEFAPTPTPSSVPDLSQALRPFVEHIFKVFGPRKVMFGSDWPVCNVGGPDGQGNWELWRRVVGGFVEGEGDGVWSAAGSEAYGVEI